MEWIHFCTMLETAGSDLLFQSLPATCKLRCWLHHNTVIHSGYKEHSLEQTASLGLFPQLVYSGLNGWFRGGGSVCGYQHYRSQQLRGLSPKHCDQCETDLVLYKHSIIYVPVQAP